MNAYETIPGLVLRKTPFRETSLVFACLTPDRGQMHFILRGGLKAGKKAFPEADLFRLLNIAYKPSSRSDLHSATGVELIRGFDGLARQPMGFRAAGWLARFALKNTVEGAETPTFFAACVAGFARLEQPEPPVAAVLLGAAFSFLADNGLLPELPPGGREAGEMLRLLRFAVDESAAAPPYTAAQWRPLARWTWGFLHDQDLSVPKGLDKLELD